jgi:hypothetical protein
MRNQTRDVISVHNALLREGYQDQWLCMSIKQAVQDGQNALETLRGLVHRQGWAIRTTKNLLVRATLNSPSALLLRIFRLRSRL